MEKQESLPTIEQARRDVAREIFGEIEEGYAVYFLTYYPQDKRTTDEFEEINISKMEWQALKNKWLG